MTTEPRQGDAMPDTGTDAKGAGEHFDVDVEFLKAELEQLRAQSLVERAVRGLLQLGARDDAERRVARGEPGAEGDQQRGDDEEDGREHQPARPASACPGGGSPGEGESISATQPESRWS